jgi:hypothetical protein
MVVSTEYLDVLLVSESFFEEIEASRLALKKR